MYWLISTILLTLYKPSFQHGFLSVPPQRSSLWREEFDNPVNYNDNQLWCGGRANIQEKGGLCGVCGDPYQGPRENEAGGKFANGIIGRKYEFGVPYIQVTVVLTAYHKGYFEFRMCPHNKPDEPVKQECLNKYLLHVAEDSNDLEKNDIQYYPPAPGIYNLTVFIPPGMRCSQCVIQWRYRTGNSWGVDADGTACVGCGIQEEFRNCADISIGDDDITSDSGLPDSVIDAKFINNDVKNNLPGADLSDRPQNQQGHVSDQVVQKPITSPERIIPLEPIIKPVITTNNVHPVANDRTNINLLDVFTNIVSGANSKKKNKKQSGNTSNDKQDSLNPLPKQNKDSSAVHKKTNGIRRVVDRKHIVGGVWKDGENALTKSEKNKMRSLVLGVDRKHIVGGVWKDRENAMTKPEKNKMRSLVLGLINRYDRLKKSEKNRKVFGKRLHGHTKTWEHDPHTQRLVKELKSFVARRNHLLYAKLTPSAKRINATAMYKNRYNVINDDSLEAQASKRFWKYSPSPYFRNSRYFSV